MRGLTRAMAKLAHVLQEVRLLRNWPTYFADHFRLLKGARVEYRLRDDTRLRLRPGSTDHGVFYEVWVLRVYSQPGFEVREGDVVLDVGAHIGMFTLQASARAAKVVAFEPTPENFALLRENVQRNARHNVVPVNAALAEKSGERTFYLSGTNTGGHSFYQASDTVSSIRVRTVSLEETVREHGLERIDLLKLDCEGGEHEVLLTCPDDVLDRVRRIAMETQDYGAGRDVAAMRRFLEAKGFSVTTLPAWSALYARRG